jgi:hypothetical protein
LGGADLYWPQATYYRFRLCLRLLGGDETVKIQLDPELENSRLTKLLKWVLYAFFISGFVLNWIIISSRPYSPDPARGFIAPIANHGTYIYLTKLEHFFFFFIGIGGVAWLFGSLVLLGWLQSKRRQKASLKDHPPKC